MKKFNAVIVTGAAGYLGGVLCKYLREFDQYVIAVDIKSSLSKEMLLLANKSEVHSYSSGCDISEYVQIRNSFVAWTQHFNITTIYHLAATKGVGADENSLARNNIAATNNIIRLANEFQIPHIIFASSAAVYNENGSVDPQNNYGHSKLLCESLLKTFFKGHVDIVRIFNMSGAYQNEIGDYAKSGVISKVVEALLNKKAFELRGTGKEKRDFVHVGQVAKTMARLGLGRRQSKGYVIYDASTKEQTTISKIIKTAEKVTGKTLRVKTTAELPGLIASVSPLPNYSAVQKYSIQQLIESEISWQISLNK